MDASPIDDTVMADATTQPQGKTEMQTDTEVIPTQASTHDGSMSPQLTDALEAMLNGSTPSPIVTHSELTKDGMETAATTSLETSISTDPIQPDAAKGSPDTSSTGLVDSDQKPATESSRSQDAQTVKIKPNPSDDTLITHRDEISCKVESLNGIEAAAFPNKIDDEAECKPIKIKKEEDMEMLDRASEQVMLPSGRLYTPIPAVKSEDALDGDFIIRPDRIGSDDEDDDHPEWELDSSPISSSDDDLDSDGSDAESLNGNHPLLSPRSQARQLMEAVTEVESSTDSSDDTSSDDSSDEGEIDVVNGEDEEAFGRPTKGQRLKTQNEIPEIVVPLPAINMTPDVKISFLGTVDTIVENSILIKGDTSGERRVVDIGSALCLEDRSLIGAISDLIGNVRQPNYSVRFKDHEQIAAANIHIGKKIFFVENFSTFAITKELYSKGSDASNLHDEEVNEHELQFSDDEEEAAHKRKLKAEKKKSREETRPADGSNRIGTRGQRGRGGMRGATRGRGDFRENRGGRGGRFNHEWAPYPQPQHVATLNYDDDEDGPYRPLARPASLANPMRLLEPPQERADFNHRFAPGSNRGGKADRGRGGHRGNHDSMGRDDRFQNKGISDRGRGGHRQPGIGGNPPNNNNSHAQSSYGRQSSEPRPTSSHSRPTSSHSRPTSSHTFHAPQSRPASSQYEAQQPRNSYSQPYAQNPPHGQRVPDLPLPRLPGIPQQGPALPSHFPTWPAFPPPPPPPQNGPINPPFQDPKVQQTIQLLQQQVREHQQRHGGPVAPFPSFPFIAGFNNGVFPPPPPPPPPVNGYTSQSNTQQTDWRSQTGGRGNSGHSQSRGYHSDNRRDQRGDYNYRGR